MLAAGCDEDKKSTEGTASAAASASAASVASPSAVATAAAVKVSAAEMTTGFAKKLGEAFAAHDPGKTAALYTQDGVMQLMGDPDVMRGRAAIEKEFTDTFGRYKDGALHVGRTWTGKTASVVEFVFTGTRSAGEMLGAKVSEKPVGFAGAMVVQFDDAGLAKTDREYLDIATNVGQVEPKLLPKGVKVRPVTTALPAGSDAFESKGTPDEAKNLDLANKIFTGIDSHKADDAMGPMSSDYVYEDNTLTGPLKKAEAQQMLGAFFTALPDMKVTSKPVQFAAGDYVVTEAVFDGTFKGAMPPFKPTNKPVTTHLLDVLQFKDGKVVKEWAYSNNAEFFTQIGVMKLTPPEAAPGTAAPQAAPGAAAAPAAPGTAAATAAVVPAGGAQGQAPAKSP
jgi:predicted ester cyclase